MTGIPRSSAGRDEMFDLGPVFGRVKVDALGAGKAVKLSFLSRACWRWDAADVAIDTGVTEREWRNALPFKSFTGVVNL